MKRLGVRSRFSRFETSFLFWLVLIPILLVRFWLDWKVAEQFFPEQSVILRFCLSTPVYDSFDQQTFYYQKHFRKIKINTDKKVVLKMGDCLQIIGKIERCQISSKPGLCLLNPEISPLSEGMTGQKWAIAILDKMSIVREKLAKTFLRNLPYPEADILSGIVLGTKRSLDPNLYQNLKSTGTLHMVVASGYNLTVIGKQPVNLFAYLWGRKLALVFGFGLIWSYAGLVGFEAPIVRAAIMLSFLFLAQFLGRKFNQFRAVIGAIWLMLMVKPDLVVSVSFQLSIAALFGLMLGGRLFARFTRIPIVGGTLAETLSAQLMVFPIIAYHFGMVSWLSPLVNMLVLPIVPTVMVLGLLGLLVSWVPIVGSVVIWTAFPFLLWMVRIINLFAGLPGIELPLRFNLWQVVFCYLLIFLLIKRSKGGDEGN